MPLPAIRSIAFTLLLLLAAGCRSAGPAPSESPVAGTPFLRCDTATSPPIRYYLAPAPDGPRPLLVVIQGSGCGPLFEARRDGLSATSAQDLIFTLAAGRFAVLVVEKPGVIPESPPVDDAGTADQASPEFRRLHSLPSWARALSTAIDAARADPRIDGRADIRLLGMSEGAITAARLARQRSDVSHIAFISGFGCDQWDDMLIVARRDALAGASTATTSAGDWAIAVRAALARTEAGLRAVAARPDSTELFEGQTHLFWSTFGRACPADDLARARAEVLVAYGTADEQVDADGVEAIRAARIEAGRPITVIPILGGDHMLNTRDTAPFQNLVGVFRESLDWMTLESPRSHR
ncbi:MAG: hypothetical protein IT436_10340 [Phycisphaerales bacterium]|nr:hypothetical protein [Phycisphaerales bacterium]